MRKPPKVGLWAKITREQLQAIVAEVTTVKSVFRALDLGDAGYNRKQFYQRIAEMNIDISHFQFEGTGVGRGHRLRAERLLDSGGSAPKSRLKTIKHRLFEAGIMRNECYRCHMQPVWMGEPLSLKISRINADANDNRIENLHMLCPNCFQQIATTRIGARGKARAMKNKATRKKDHLLEQLVKELPTRRKK